MLKDNTHNYKLHYLKLFVLFWLIAFLVFIKAWNAGWNFDAIFYSYHLKDKTLQQMLQLHLDVSVRYVYHIVQYVLYNLFGYHGWCWYILKTFLYALLTLQIYVFIIQLLHLYKIKNAKTLALITSILFIVSPYNQEALLNQPTIHYIYTLLILFYAWNIFLKSYYKEISTLQYIFTIFLYALAVFSLEQSFIFPLIVSVIIITNPQNKHTKKQILQFIIVPCILICSYLLINQLQVNSIVGHYGIDRHTRYTIDRIAQNTSKVFLDYLAYIEYWNMNKIYAVYNILYQYPKLIFIVFVIIFIVLNYFSWIKKNNQIALITVVLIMFLFSLSTTITLQILSIIPIEDDRYNFLLAPFCILFLLLFFQFIDKKLMYFFTFTTFVISLFLSIRNANYFNIAQQTIDNNIENFPFQEKKSYVLLASAQYIEGCAIWDIIEDEKKPYFDRWQTIEKALYAKKNINIFNNVYHILNYNIKDINDCPEVSVVNDSTIRMTLPCCGKWWWKRRHGASNGENDLYKIQLTNDWQQEVFITFKRKPKDAVYLYQCGTTYKSINF